MKLKLLFFILFSFFSVFAEQQPTIRISNYCDYISVETLKDFSRQYGIHVIYDTHDTNDVIMKKLYKGNEEGYDIVILSADRTDTVVKKRLAAPLDKSKLPNIKNLMPEHLNPLFDKGNIYTIPYFWGTIGILTNSKSNNGITRWADFRNPEFKDKILISNEATDVFAVMLKSLGYSLNTDNPQEIKKAYQLLMDILPNVRILRSGNVASAIARQNIAAGMVFNGDAVSLISRDSSFIYIYPEDGAVRWVDSMIIPVNSPNKEAAHLFINFILDAQNAAALAQEVGYGLPNQKAYAVLPDSIKSNPAVYPPLNLLKNSEIIYNSSEKTYKLKMEYWNKFMAEYTRRYGAI